MSYANPYEDVAVGRRYYPGMNVEDLSDEQLVSIAAAILDAGQSRSNRLDDLLHFIGSLLHNRFEGVPDGVRRLLLSEARRIAGSASPRRFDRIRHALLLIPELEPEDLLFLADPYPVDSIPPLQLDLLIEHPSATAAIREQAAAMPFRSEESIAKFGRKGDLGKALARLDGQVFVDAFWRLVVVKPRGASRAAMSIVGRDLVALFGGLEGQLERALVTLTNRAPDVLNRAIKEGCLEGHAAEKHWENLTGLVKRQPAPGIVFKQLATKHVIPPDMDYRWLWVEAYRQLSPEDRKRYAKDLFHPLQKAVLERELDPENDLVAETLAAVIAEAPRQSLNLLKGNHKQVASHLRRKDLLPLLEADDSDLRSWAITHVGAAAGS